MMEDTSISTKPISTSPSDTVLFLQDFDFSVARFNAVLYSPTPERMFPQKSLKAFFFPTGQFCLYKRTVTTKPVAYSRLLSFENF